MKRGMRPFISKELSNVNSGYTRSFFVAVPRVTYRTCSEQWHLDLMEVTLPEQRDNHWGRKGTESDSRFGDRVVPAFMLI